MKKIAFYVAHFDFRGTGNAIYNYADYNEHILNNKSIIIYKYPSLYPHFDNKSIFENFKKRFDIYFFNSKEDLTNILTNCEINYVYFLCSGEEEHDIAKLCPPNIITLGHFVFDTKAISSFTKCAGISECISSRSYIPYIYHIVNMQETNDNMRKELNIPEDALVIGRIGGYESFDIEFVFDSIDYIIENTKNIYFIFAPSPIKYKRYNDTGNQDARIKYIDLITDSYNKRKFINTCDCMIHARKEGESFGISVLEFIYCNKPVFTTFGKDNQHIINLGNNAIIYRNKEELIQQITRFNKRDCDISLLKEFTPFNVMHKFNKIFLTGDCASV